MFSFKNKIWQEQTISWPKTQFSIRVLRLALLQYPALCVSLGLLLVCVRACSSWLSSLLRLSCKFSADTSAVLIAPTASVRKEDKPPSIPAFSHRRTECVCLCVCVPTRIHKSPQIQLTVFLVTTEWNRVVRITFLLAVFLDFIYSTLLLSLKRQSWEVWNNSTGVH